VEREELIEKNNNMIQDVLSRYKKVIEKVVASRSGPCELILQGLGKGADKLIGGLGMNIYSLMQWFKTISG